MAVSKSSPPSQPLIIPFKGDKLSSGQRNTNFRNIERYINQPWQDYTASITGSTTSPTIEGTISARFKLLGKSCFVRIFIATTSGTIAGSGEYTINLPLTSSISVTDIEQTLSVMLFDGLHWCTGFARIAANTNYIESIYYQNPVSSGMLLFSSANWDILAGDYFSVYGVYECQ